MGKEYKKARVFKATVRLHAGKMGMCGITPVKVNVALHRTQLESNKNQAKKK